MRLSPTVSADDWPGLAIVREQARALGREGLMLKAREGAYGVGRRKGDDRTNVWWKWKLDPMSVDAVLIYAQRGHGRRSGVYSDYTFALWSAEEGAPGRELIPFAKAYSGLSDAEMREMDAIIRRTTVETFGPVRSVKPTQVFELGFEGLAESKRHRSGIAVRFPRMLRWRRDKPVSEADTLEALRALLPGAARADSGALVSLAVRVFTTKGTKKHEVSRVRSVPESGQPDRSASPLLCDFSFSRLRPPRDGLSRRLDQFGKQRPYVWDSQAGYSVITRSGTEFAVASRDDISEASGPEQRIKGRVEEGQGRQSDVSPRLVEQGAEPGPNRSGPARPADSGRLPMKDQEGAFVRISRSAHVRDRPVILLRHPCALLPRRTLKEHAVAAAASRPTIFLLDRAVRGSKPQTCSPDCDDCGVGSGIFRLKRTIGALPIRVWVRSSVPARDEDIDACCCKLQEFLMLGRDFAVGPAHESLSKAQANRQLPQTGIPRRVDHDPVEGLIERNELK